MHLICILRLQNALVFVVCLSKILENLFKDRMGQPQN